MLEVQKYLIETKGDFKSLETTLGISSNFHLSDERVILNYSMIDSPKLDERVRDSRALTLNKNTFEIIAKSYRKFMNWGEGTRDEMNRFHWDKCWTTEKLDGSLISYFYWNNSWHVQTRNSYGDGYINNSIYTWRELFESALGDVKLEPVPGRNYVFELCSLLNQIVTIYREPSAYLLTIFDGEIEWTHEAVESFAKEFGLKRPFSVECKDPFEVNSEVAKYAGKNRDFEGFVVKDCFNNRYKFKSLLYLELSHLSQNGCIGSLKHIVPIVLRGEESEMIAYFPYIEETVLKVKTSIDKILKELDDNWFTFSVEKSRKKFAISIEKVPFKSVLFGVYGKKYEEVNLREELSKHSEAIADYLKGIII